MRSGNGFSACKMQGDPKIVLHFSNLTIFLTPRVLAAAGEAGTHYNEMKKDVGSLPKSLELQNGQDWPG